MDRKRVAAYIMVNVIVFASILMPSLASAQTDSDRFSIFSKDSIARYYIGGSISWTHHTGLSPDRKTAVDNYSPGGKVFVGYRFNPAVQFEVAYHYLGSGSIGVGFPVITSWTHESAQAISGSVLYFFPPLPQLVNPTSVPMRIFLRGGLAYKDIRQDGDSGAFREGILSGVIGGGVEFTVTPRIFTRIEIEHLSTAIGGPLQTTPVMRGIGAFRIGGTRDVVNLMNTEIMLSAGLNW